MALAALLTAVSFATSASAEDGAVDTVLKALDLKTDPGQPADFVRASRPDTEGDYIPVGTKHPERTLKVKSPAELKAMEAGLDAARSQQDKIAGRKPPPNNPKPAKKPTVPDKTAGAPATQN